MGLWETPRGVTVPPSGTPFPSLHALHSAKASRGGWESHANKTGGK